MILLSRRFWGTQIPSQVMWHASQRFTIRCKMISDRHKCFWASGFTLKMAVTNFNYVGITSRVTDTDCNLLGDKPEECRTPQPPHFTSHLYCNMPPICIAVLLVPPSPEEREVLSVLLAFVSQYASHLYHNTPPFCIAVLLRKSWWLWSPGCSPIIMITVVKTDTDKRSFL